MTLQNEQLGLVFDRNTGTLTAIENRLTGETYGVQGDEFEVEAVQFHTGFADAKLVGLAVEGKTLTASYQSETSGVTAGLSSSAVRTVGQANRGTLLTIHVRYTLRGHFAEKELTLTCGRNCGLKKVVVSRPTFSGPNLQIVAYRYPKFGRKPGEEPCCTFFGRTAKGGFFTGLELPFDASSVKWQRSGIGVRTESENGRRRETDVRAGVFRRLPSRASRTKQRPSYALPSESEAMVAMTSAILGPPRFGLVPMACGWHSEMEHGPYTEKFGGRRHEIARFSGRVRHRLGLATAIPGAARRRR